MLSRRRKVPLWPEMILTPKLSSSMNINVNAYIQHMMLPADTWKDILGKSVKPILKQQCMLWLMLARDTTPD